MKLFLVIGIGCLVLILLLVNYAPYDSTDPPNGRSGFTLMTDALTGCQYLASGLYPRMTAEGKQLCVKGKE